MRLQKSEIQSAIITTIVTILLLLLLLFLGMKVYKNEVDEGVMVSFGNEGFGEQISSPLPTTSPQPTSTPVAVPPPVPDEKLMTQEDPSVVLNEEKKRKEKEQNEQIIREKRRAEEQRRMEEERLRKDEEARLEAERIRQEKADAAKKLAGNAFANKDKGSGTTETTSGSMQGNPTGSGVSPDGGASWSLSGRSLISNGNKLYQPSYSGDQQGKIVISIRVDAEGNVTSAEIATGTTITDTSMREASKVAAKKNKFSTGGSVAIGTITFHFKLR